MAKIKVDTRDFDKLIAQLKDLDLLLVSIQKIKIILI